MATKESIAIAMERVTRRILSVSQGLTLRLNAPALRFNDLRGRTAEEQHVEALTKLADWLEELSLAASAAVLARDRASETTLDADVMPDATKRMKKG